jgi:putative ABC transport system permease protein
MIETFRRMLSRIHGTVARHKAEQDFTREFDEHLKLLTERFIQRGMSAEEARFAARRQFGGVTQLRENLHERSSLPQLEILSRDIRYALRQLWNAPAFTVAAVLTLALGIGANTAVFAVVDAVVLRPLPYPEPQRLVAFASWDTGHGAPRPDNLSYPNFFDFRSANRVFEHLVCYRDSEFSIAGTSQAIHVDGEIVSWDLFDALRVSPELGRGFLPEEEKAGTHVAVLGHELWETQFGADPSVVGRAVTINGNPFTIVGVAPAQFQFPPQNAAVQLWTTLAEDAAHSEFDPLTTQRGARVLDGIGRLRQGVSIETARSHMNSIAAALARQYPEEKTRASTLIIPELERLTGDARKPVLMLLAAVFLVLLIACANIANLVLARSVERQREMAVRSAIGASRLTVIRQLLTESLTLALIGSIAGILLALACLRLFLPLAGESIPRISQAAIDGRVLAFSIALAVFTCLLFSLAPALQLTKVDVVNWLKEGSRSVTGGSERLRSGLVIGQVSVGLMLVTGAGMLIATFLFLERRDLGFKADHVLTFDLNLPAQYKTAQQGIFSAELLSRLRELPAVQSAAAGWPLPMIGDQVTISFVMEGQADPESRRSRSDMAIVTPRYFGTMGMRLLQGRDFTERDDDAGLPVVIVNQAFAGKFFAGQNALGKRIESGATNGKSGPLMREIIGVVGNAKQSALELAPEPIYYLPYKQMPWGIGTIVVRTTAPPRSLESSARAVVASLDKQIPMYRVRTLDELSSSAIAEPRFQMFLLGSFALIAMLLTAIGLYGVLAYSVIQRTREIGVRMALGATRAAVLNMVLRHGTVLVATGLLIGLAGAIAAENLLQSMLYGVRPNDLFLLVAAFGLIVLSGLLAAYLPARRAASVDVVQALRSE